MSTIAADTAPQNSAKNAQQRSTSQPTSDLGSRYRGLIISIALFLALIIALLAYNFYASNILAENTALINTTNRVATSTQKVVKDLYDLQKDTATGINFDSAHLKEIIKDLEENHDYIDKAIGTLDKGGPIADADGHVQTIPGITDPAIRGAYDETSKQWNTLDPKLHTFIESLKTQKATAQDLQAAGDLAETSGHAINDGLEKLTDDTYEKSHNQASRIRLVQGLGVAAILAYFVIFIFFFVRRLRKSDEEAVAAQKETAEIMANVNTGLFLLNKDLTIGQQYSAAMDKIMGGAHIAGENLTKLLKNKVSDKDLETTEGYINQLYNPRVKEKLVNDLNPLKQVMLHDETAKGMNQTRYLDFKFSRVYNNSAIEKILVNVQDVTHQVRLEQRLEQERAQNDLQIEMLTTILNVSPKIIAEFIGNTKNNITKINEILKTPGNTQNELQEKLKGMYRIMHSLKGEASSLNLHSFTAIAANFEEKLKGLQTKDKLAGNDFLPLTIHLDELLNLSNTIDALGRRINQGGADTNPTSTVSNATATTTVANTGMNEFYEQFADNIATRQNKQVKLKATGFSEVQLSHQTENSLKEIVIQLVRNAVVHGIESPEERAAAGKPAIGNINLSLLDLAESYKLTIEDDGRGINFPAIKEKAIQMGYNADEVNSWSEQKLISLLFKSGFSTKDTADEDAGRGVGMDIIKEDIQALQGHLSVDTKEGQLTRFTIRLPKNPTVE